MCVRIEHAAVFNGLSRNRLKRFMQLVTIRNHLAEARCE
jgi:hypothetical protein